MGLAFSCFHNVDTYFESYHHLLANSLSFEGDNKSHSFIRNGRPSEFVPFCSDSGKIEVQECLSFEGVEEMAAASGRTLFDAAAVVIQPQSLRRNDHVDAISEGNGSTPILDPAKNRHLAALKLQKTYKSFRTRRQLADCAVLVEQRWWKLLDFAELKHSSVSFFEMDKHETALSRWSRARTRAAKLGKGLSKDDKAQKLALQHWLEAIDPRHRYGHNLQFYYANWLHCNSKQPFFYWLDIGEGRDVNLERCPRSKLQQQCIKYLGPRERRTYEVITRDGKLIYKQTGKLLDTREGPEDVKWIFVLSASKNLYVGQKRRGTFQHSSFLAGGATLSAGRLIAEEGVLKAVWPHSGHYLPTEENFEEFIAYLSQHNVDLTAVKRAPTDGDSEEFYIGATGLRTSMSVPDLRNQSAMTSDASCRKYSKDDESARPRSSQRLPKLASLAIPRRENVNEQQQSFVTPKPWLSDSSSSDGYETADEFLSDGGFFTVAKHNLFDQEEEHEYQEPIPKEQIMKRIKSHKGMKSYQLANQLSCRWTTGAGPRIGCMRDYPSELQFRVLEDACLSPRCAVSTTHTPGKNKNGRQTFSQREKR